VPERSPAWGVPPASRASSVRDVYRSCQFVYTTRRPRNVSVRDARAHFAELIGGVHASGKPIVIERHGRPVVALVPVEQIDARQRNDDPVDEAGLDALVADTPALRAVIGVGRRFAPRSPLPLAWAEARDAAREDYVSTKARKKGLQARTPGV